MGQPWFVFAVLNVGRQVTLPEVGWMSASKKSLSARRVLPRGGTPMLLPLRGRCYSSSVDFPSLFSRTKDRKMCKNWPRGELLILTMTTQTILDNNDLITDDSIDETSNFVVLHKHNNDHYVTNDEPKFDSFHLCPWSFQKFKAWALLLVVEGRIPRQVFVLRNIRLGVCVESAECRLRKFCTPFTCGIGCRSTKKAEVIDFWCITLASDRTVHKNARTWNTKMCASARRWRKNNTRNVEDMFEDPIQAQKNENAIQYRIIYLCWNLNFGCFYLFVGRI